MSVVLSILGVVGGVLLFLLKCIGILLLVVLVLAVLLMLCPFCADVLWENETLIVKAGALGITFPVFRYPAPEKPKKEKKKKSKKKPEAEAGSNAPQKGEADPEHRLHHPAGDGQADQGCLRGAADHQDQHLPRRPGRGPRRCSPQLRQAERMARQCAGPFGPLPLP